MTDAEPPAARVSPRARSAVFTSPWPARVLVVDDEPALVEVLTVTLEAAGFVVESATSVTQAVAVAERFDPEVALLDVLLPDGSGFDLCHRLCTDRPGLGVIFLTARDDVDDRLTGLALGGDDYITKPFSVAEVVARVNVLLRRLAPAPADDRAAGDPTGDDSLLRLADLELDEAAHRVRRGDRPIELSPTEFRLLRHLLHNADHVVSKDQLLDRLWDHATTGDHTLVEKTVSRLRRKLTVGDEAPLLHTVRGFGYVLRADARP